MRPWGRRAAVAALAAGTALVAASCGSPGTAAPAGPGSGDEGPGARLTYVMTDHAFSGPDHVEAGPVRLTAVNEGRTYHQLTVARVDDGATVDEVTAAAAEGDTTAVEEMTTAHGGVNLLDPGGSGTAELSLDEPGRYVLLCFMVEPDGHSHLMAGMTAPLTVTATTATHAEPPPADAHISMRDFAYDVDTTSLQGARRVSFDNDGTVDHEAIVVRLRPGRTNADLLTYLGARQAGQDLPLSEAPGEAIGGPGATGPGRSTVVDLDLTPGDYAIFCAIPDPEHDGMPHLAEGMSTTFTIR